VGETQDFQPWLFEPQFNRAVKVRTSDERITSDAGLLLLREADYRLGLTEHLASQVVLRFFKEALRLTEPLAYMVDVRINAGYVHGEVLDWLSERKLRFLGRIKTNAVLEELAAPQPHHPSNAKPNTKRVW